MLVLRFSRSILRTEQVAAGQVEWSYCH